MATRLNVDFTLTDCLFGAAKLTKKSDPSNNSYSGYGIRLDSCSLFSYPFFDWDKNVIFQIGNSSSVHTDKKKKDILVLGEVPT